MEKSDNIKRAKKLKNTKSKRENDLLEAAGLGKKANLKKINF